MSNYNQTRSFNLGIAEEVSVEAALIYNDLSYYQESFAKGKWFYRNYKQFCDRLPYSERTIRTHIDKLVKAGWIKKKISKVNGAPVAHYKICRFLSATFAETMESAKVAETTINKTTNKTTMPSADSRSDNFGGTPPNSASPPSKHLLTQLIEIVNPKEKVTADRLRILNGRLKDYTPAEIVGAARAFSKSEWHKENKQMSIDNLIAPSKFGRWYTQATEETDDVEKAKAEFEEARRQTAERNRELNRT